MKAILKSCKLKILVNILNKKATLLITKKFPKDYKGWVYIYCTKDRNHTAINMKMFFEGKDFIRNGKVVARFYCDKVEEIIDIVSQKYEFDGLCESYGTKTLKTKSLLDKAQLNYLELADYLNDYTPFGYAIHISNLEIFDRPKELSEFKVSKKVHKCDICIFNPLCAGICVKETYSTIKTPLTKAPQNMCYVEVEE